MSRQHFTTFALPAVVMAALSMAQSAGAFPLPPPPPPPALPLALPPQGHHFYGWGGYYPYSFNYYPYYGSSPAVYPYIPPGSLIGGGASSSFYQPTSSFAAPSEGGVANTDMEKAAERRLELAQRALQKGNYAEAQRQCAQVIQLLSGRADVRK